MHEPLLELCGVRGRIAGAEVLHGIDLEVASGEALFVLGPNGAGKSTLLRAVAGGVEISGSIRLAERELAGLGPRERIRAGLSLCPEGRRLFPEMTVAENLLLGAHLRRDRAGIATDLAEMSDRLPWLSGRLGQLAGTLSGGEQQIVAVARALMARPRLLLLDEPTVGLSAAAIALLQDWLRLQTRDRGVTILGTEQNVVFARGIATRIAVLTGGRIRAAGLPDEIVPEGVTGIDLAARFFGDVGAASSDSG